MNYAEQLAALTAADPALGSQVADLRNLEAILRWAPGAGIALAGIDLVQQDEYSYDLFLPLTSLFRVFEVSGESERSPDSRWLVFGVS